MKIAFAWKWWAWKTTLSSIVIDKVSRDNSILALDLDSNVNLANALWFKNSSDLISFWQKKEEVMTYTWSTTMTDWENRVYLPKSTDWFYDYNNKFINEHSISNNNIKVMSLWFIDDDKRWIESMCDYYEMSKVFINHINLDQNQYLIADLAAWVEMISRATIMSFDLIFVVTDANFKNLKVTRQILRGLELTWFKKEEICIITNKYLSNNDLDFIKKEFTDYNIINWMPYSDELYEIDSDNNLTDNKIDWLNIVTDNIVKYIYDFNENTRKDIDYIYNRIDNLDKIKNNFLK